MNRSDALAQYKDYLILKNYSDSTKKSYLIAINTFFDFCQLNKDRHSNISDFAKAFLVHRFNLGLKWTSVNVSYSAIRILCDHVYNIKWDYSFIPRPKGRQRLPTIVSCAQIEKMINFTFNLKHKTILLIFYTSGIRITELINLTISDILFDRNQLKVNLGKGGKDRIISIPSITVEYIKAYCLKYTPKIYLFEGMSNNSLYSGSSIRKIIEQAALRVKISFRVTSHSLRYAYATHHIENGTDLVTLQSQLGHSNIQTTIKYVKLCQIENRHLNHPITNLNIVAPLSIT